MKQLVVLLLLAALAIFAGTGGNTANGFGKDVSNAGDAIQDGTVMTRLPGCRLG